VGSKKNPIWRVVVADQRSPRDGRFIETIGRYNPQTEPSTIAIDEERLQHWLARGAQPTGAVKQLMKAQTKAGGPSVPETAAEPAATEAEPAAAATESAAAAPEPSEAAEAAPEPAEGAEADPEAADREAAPESAEAAPESAEAAAEPASAAPDPAPAAPDEVAEGRPEPPAADS
jgi:small subunit ribosomal protein S16